MTTVKEVYKSQIEMAAVRLVKEAPIMSKTPISNPEDAVMVLGEYLCQMDREVICIINLRTDGVPINCSICSMGSIDQAVSHPREIMKTAILSNASGIIMMHNHPSSNLNPSKEDTMITDRMATVCEILGIPLMDHIIVGGDNSNYFSFKEKEILPMKAVKLQEDYTKLNIDAPTVAEDHVINKSNRRRERIALAEMSGFFV